MQQFFTSRIFLLTPLREGRLPERWFRFKMANFYSRPCGRGDLHNVVVQIHDAEISTHAPAGGATCSSVASARFGITFLLTPLREGRLIVLVLKMLEKLFLLTPLREGRPMIRVGYGSSQGFLLTPLREGRLSGNASDEEKEQFLLTPLREGRQQFSTSPS